MPRKSRKNVGVIGLGIIGQRAAAGLRAAGFHVFVWNRSPKPTPNFVGSPAEVVELCEIIQIFVADATALFEVIESMAPSLTGKHVVVCCSTVGPEATIEAARLVEDRGAKFLDAPFTGSKGAAEKRELVYYVGGDETTYLRVKPVLEATSKAIVRLGAIGHAATLKVVTNMISAVTIQTLAEALAIVRKAGLEPETLVAALEHNAARSGVIELKLPKMISGDYEPHFSLKHMFKDVQLGIHMANALDIEVPVTTVTAGIMYGALNQGWADLDYSVLYQIYEQQRQAAALAAAPAPEILKIEDLPVVEVPPKEAKIEQVQAKPVEEPKPVEPPKIVINEPAPKIPEPERAPIVEKPLDPVPAHMPPPAFAIAPPPIIPSIVEPSVVPPSIVPPSVIIPSIVVPVSVEKSDTPPSASEKIVAATIVNESAPKSDDAKPDDAKPDEIKSDATKPEDAKPKPDDAKLAEGEKKIVDIEKKPANNGEANVEPAVVHPVNPIKRWFVSRRGG